VSKETFVECYREHVGKKLTEVWLCLAVDIEGRIANGDFVNVDK
jgi:hypothetical protein